MYYNVNPIYMQDKNVACKVSFERAVGCSGMPQLESATRFPMFPAEHATRFRSFQIEHAMMTL